MRNLSAALVFVLGAGAAVAEVTIAALGDSLTAGYGLPTEDGFVPQMQGWLRYQGFDVTLVNAGVSGDTTAGGQSRVDWTLTSEVDGMILALGANDLLRGIDPTVSKANLRGILEAAREADVGVLLVGMEASSNFGLDYKQAFDAMFPALAAEFDVPLYPYWFEGLRGAGSTPVEVRDYMQPDGIHPNAEGVELIVEDMGPAVRNFVREVEDGG